MRFARAEGVGLPEGAARAAKRSQEAERVEDETRPAYASPPSHQTKTERNTNMKLTKADIKQKRAELVEVLLKIEKLKNEKTSLEKTLDVDFAQNESAYRNGIVTENGVLMRKPSWKTTAKPVVEVA